MPPRNCNDGPGRESTEPRVIFGDVVGAGLDSRREVTVVLAQSSHTLTMWRALGDGEPRVSAATAASLLGLKRARDLRELIERTWPEGRRPYCRRTARRQPVGPNGHGTRQFFVDEYWLTEAEFLKLCARSRTQVADAVLDDMIRVYMAARRGLFTPDPVEAYRRAAHEEAERNFQTEGSRAREVERVAAELAAAMKGRCSLRSDKRRLSFARQVILSSAGAGGWSTHNLTDEQFRLARHIGQQLIAGYGTIARREQKALPADTSGQQGLFGGLLNATVTSTDGTRYSGVLTAEKGGA